MTVPGRVVLVVGPPLAGVGGVVAALSARVPGVDVVEADGLAGRAPDAVLAVFSAAAPLTRSDWASVEPVVVRAGRVIGVVSKIDAHLRWRDVVAADRARVAGWDGRYGATPWLGVAAAPGLGGPRVDALVDLLRAESTRSPLPVSRFRAVRAPLGPDPAEVRRVLAGARLRLLRVVRDESATLRAELRDGAAEVGVGGSAGFEALVTAAALRFHVRLAEEVDRVVDTAAAGLGLTATPAPPRPDPPDTSRTTTSSRRLEGQLVAVLGVGFGTGVAVACSRLLAGLVPGSSALGWAAGIAAGLALVVWVVRARGLLHDRAMLDRWAVEVVAALRWHGEAMVAERLLGAESQWAVGVREAPPKSGVASRALTRDVVTDQYEWW
ncbi:hypothetical protein ASD37_24485 [Mycobacterium sp. Root135]|uniref:hypothetical protein n=1 Tax=Mycobacterium sp. Root135 TaxID=1736457 RepID=UPI00070186B3|nr:hypothetical protein [Mycobacterium sp. Root135]KQY03978.1 hypothetical protein ASD37_24485 [Mycobacterium sp. Root135]